MGLSSYIEPSDPKIWQSLTGGGNINKYYKGKRNLGGGSKQYGAGIGRGLLSNLWWQFIQPRLEKLGRAIIEKAGSTAVKSIRSRGGGRLDEEDDIFQNGRRKKRKKTSSSTTYNE